MRLPSAVSSLYEQAIMCDTTSQLARLDARVVTASPAATWPFGTWRPGSVWVLVAVQLVKENPGIKWSVRGGLARKAGVERGG